MLKKSLATGAVVPVLMLSLAVGTVSAQAKATHVSIATMPTLKAAKSHSGFGFLRNPTPNMTSHGGQVETTPSIYLDFWGSWWNTTTTTGTDGSFSYTNTNAMTSLKGFSSNVGGSHVA